MENIKIIKRRSDDNWIVRLPRSMEHLTKQNIQLSNRNIQHKRVNRGRSLHNNLKSTSKKIEAYRKYYTKPYFSERGVISFPVRGKSDLILIVEKVYEESPNSTIEILEYNSEGPSRHANSLEEVEIALQNSTQVILEIANKSLPNAYQESKDKGLTVCVLRGNEIVEEFPDGTTNILKKIIPRKKIVSRTFTLK